MFARFLSRRLLAIVAAMLPLWNAHAYDNDIEWVRSQLRYTHRQVAVTLSQLPGNSLPRNIAADSSSWHLVNYDDWTSGFFAGILWYNYLASHEARDKRLAEHYTALLEPLLEPDHKVDHDVGFQVMCSYGNAYKATGDKRYLGPIFKGAAKLAGLYNPHVGTILSWPHMADRKGWEHNTIMDNMMNLELLFFAAKHGGTPEYRDMAVAHATTTMRNHFRPDFTCYHVALYDSHSGKLLRGCTNQGYSDGSFWARGQAWAIYGYTMVYRETGDKTFLRFVENVADVYLSRLPSDLVPYWDFDDPMIPVSPKDASSAAIVASALLELSTLEDDAVKGAHYGDMAVRMLHSLSSPQYQSRNAKPSFLLHSTGNKPAGYEIDASINYADYYYIEALTRYHNSLRGDGAPDSRFPGMPTKGVNLAGAEFYHKKMEGQGLLGKDYHYPTTRELDYWHSKGLDLIRLPFKWDRIQREVGGTLSADEVGVIRQLLREADKRGMAILIDMHNYGRRNWNGTYRVIGDVLQPEHFAGAWAMIARELKDEPALWGYGLCNEPHDMLAACPWDSIAQTAIDSIRLYDHHTPIVVGGNEWSSAARWRELSDMLKNLRDPSDNLIFEAHCYFDNDASGIYRGGYDEEKACPTIGVERARPFVEWLEENGKRGIMGEFGVPENDPRWLECLDLFLDYLKAHGVATTYWAAGARWNNYILSAHPTDDYGTDRRQVPVLMRH